MYHNGQLCVLLTKVAGLLLEMTRRLAAYAKIREKTFTRKGLSLFRVWSFEIKVSTFCIFSDILHRCFCMLVMLWFLPSTDFFSSNFSFFKNHFRNTIIVSNNLNPAQARHLVGPELDPKCLQRLTADDTNSEKAEICRILNLAFQICMILD